MQIQVGKQYADNKLYRGIKHVDGYPLTSEDLHEISDTIYKKQSYLMNNIIGYGLLNPLKLVRDAAGGIKLEEPAVLLIDGDISLVHSDKDSLVPIDLINKSSYPSSLVAILGWYQHIDTSTKFKNYGGVLNSDELENDLLKLGVQLSSRYQFRWIPIIVDQSMIESGTLNISIENRDKNGDLVSGTSNITATERVGDAYVAPKPSSMDYAISDLYIIPMCKYNYNNSTISNLTSVLPVAPKGTAGFINSEVQPVGEFSNGTVWYNPITGKFKIYVKESGGFIDRNSTMAFMRYRSHYTVLADNENSRISIPINISELAEGDLFRVMYGGLVLTPDLHYTVDYALNNITLIDFPITKDEIIVFDVTKLVEANDITNVTAKFNSHMIETSTSEKASHVKLSDTIDTTLDASKGVAITPKALTNIIDMLNNNIEPWSVGDVLIGKTEEGKLYSAMIDHVTSEIVDGETITEYPLFSFKSKHRGTILIDLDAKYGNYAYEDGIEDETIYCVIGFGVYVNGELRERELGGVSIYSQYSERKLSWSITVNPGDVVDIKADACIESTGTTNIVAAISNLALYANTDFPYKYYSDDLTY